MTRPRVLLGEFTGKRVPRLQAMGWGRMMIARPFTPYPWEPWALDNGAFRMWRQGKAYDWTRFTQQLARLDQAIVQGRVTPPLFAVIPDRPMDGAGSLELTKEWVLRTRFTAPDFASGVPEWGPSGSMTRFWTPLYIAVQDGMAPAELEQDFNGVPLIVYFDGIFLGGSAPFKQEMAPAWRRLLDRWGGRLHYGRAGTLPKLRHAHQIGADSLDSAFPMWTDERWTRFEEAWLALGRPPQYSLPLAA